MPTQYHDLTDTPTDIKTSLSLEDGERYPMQYQGRSQARFASATSAPDANTKASFVARPFEPGQLIPTSGENIYAWGDGVLVVGSKIETS